MRLARLKAALLLAGCLFAAALGAALWNYLAAAAPDPGPVDFANLRRSSGAPDALVCSKSVCSSAQADIDPPIFTMSAARLREKILAYAGRASLTDRIRPAKPSEELRFVQRNSLFGPPLYIDVLPIARSSGAATVAIYVRGPSPPFSHKRDLARLRQWLNALAD